MIIISIINIIIFLIGILVLSILEFNNEKYMYYTYFFCMGYIVYESAFNYFKKYSLNKKKSETIIPDDKKAFYHFTGVYINPYPSRDKGTDNISFKEETTFCYKKTKEAPFHYPDFLMCCDNETKYTKTLKYFYLWDFLSYQPLKNIRNPSDFFQNKECDPFAYNNQEEFKEYFKYKQPLSYYFKIPYFNFSIPSLILISMVVFYFQVNYGIILLSFLTLTALSVFILLFLEKEYNVRVINKIEKFEVFKRNGMIKHLNKNLFKDYDLLTLNEKINLEHFLRKGMKPISFDIVKKEKDEFPEFVNVRPDFHNIKYRYEFKNDPKTDLFNTQEDTNNEKIKKLLVDENIDFLSMDEEDKMLINLNINFD